ncbi:MAG: transglutaminase-like domain-containing protein [Bacteroidales bacterium]|nr:transglutaminase-like domain-containing protein [Bacteroidales bacterium]
MKNKSTLSLLAALMLLIVGCRHNPHFIDDRDYRDQVHQDFLQRQTLAQGRADALFGGMDTLSNMEREALEFLYAYMPYSDLADYDQQFYLDQIRTAFAARDTFSWGKTIPEDVFRHFVLVYRVNNENLDTARIYMFHQLKDRVKNMTMEQAALEVNHWCHEYVAYRAADARTSAPLATMRTSLGRCGEESTFTVTAMRAVGIPARQCYTPRWAHCDDNHAWVEVWVDGEWKFLGACEPDPELNMGWFSVPSTRCLMVHSKAFGRYHGDEEVVKETALYSELNLLSHYAPTKHVVVTVTDAQGKPMQGATVKFKMYNYAEYYTLATYKADAEGKARLTTGLGDLLVWATDGTYYDYAKLDVRQQDGVTLRLTRQGGSEYVDNLEIVPPEAGQAKVVASDAAADANAKRIAYEDSIRSAYMSTFPTQENYLQLVDKHNCGAGIFTDAQLWEIIQKSEGNYAEVIKFINNYFCRTRAFDHIYDYLKSYSDKDLRDVPAEMFEAQLTGFNFGRTTQAGRIIEVSYDVYKQGIMPARISNELIRDWRKPLAEALKAISSVDELKAWTVKNIAVDDTGNYYNCPISPMGVYQLRHADAHSRDIFFVAACRALLFPAYLDNATNTIFVYRNNTWEKLAFVAETPVQPTAQLTLTYRGGEPKVPVYYPHFTIQKFVDGDFVTFDFEDDPRMATFPATLQLEPGYYCLSTGNRYPEGDVLNRMEFFTVADGQALSKEIIIRPLVERQGVAEGQIDNKLTVVEGVSVADYAGKKGAVLAFMGTHREPAKHLVKEMLQHKSEFVKWGGKTFATTTDAKNPELLQLQNTDIKCMETGAKSQLETAVAQALKIDRYEYPLVVFVDQEGNIRFHSTGYKIGLAELLLKYCK